MSNYIKETYYGKLALDNTHEKIAIDESVFCHIDGTQKIWVIGLINIHTYEFRLETVIERNSEIIKFHVGTDNNIITDGWSAYDWLNNSDYHHIVHILGHHDFGFGNETTSHIESVWSDLKRIIIKIICFNKIR